jgi:hypothetical protein
MSATQEPSSGDAPKYRPINPVLKMAPPSPLLTDLDWLQGFKGFVRRFLAVAHDISTHHRLPSFPLWMGAENLEIAFNRLASHLMRVVEESSDRRRRQPVSTDFALEEKVWQAYQWACALMEKSKLNGADGKAILNDPANFLPEGYLQSWQRVLDLLDHFDFEATRDALQASSQPTVSQPDQPEAVAPTAPPREDDRPAAASGTEAAVDQHLSAENRALAIALKWTKEGKPLRVARIAEEAGCTPSYLHRCKAFKDFLATKSRFPAPRIKRP